MKLRIKPSFVIYLLFLSYLNPLGLFYPFVFAAVLHELSHIAVLKLLKKPVLCITLSFAEANILTPCLTCREELLSAAAGPFLNLSCAFLFSRAFSDFAAISFLLGVFNLLPVLPFDGGRMLRSSVRLVKNKVAFHSRAR